MLLLQTNGVEHGPGLAFFIKNQSGPLEERTDRKKKT